MLLQLLAELGLVEIIGKGLFDTDEARSLGRCKAVEERQLVEEHGEIGGKSGHFRNPP